MWYSRKYSSDVVDLHWHQNRVRRVSWSSVIYTTGTPATLKRPFHLGRICHIFDFFLSIINYAE